MANPLKPDEDIVGTITTASGALDLVLERVNRGGPTPVWLFSRKTLDAIPDAYDDVDLVELDRFVPRFLNKRHIGGIRSFDWLALIVILFVCYQLSGFVGRLVRPLAVGWRRRRGPAGDMPANLVPGAVRLLLTAVAIRWLLGVIELPLLERVFWSGIATTLTIVGVVWLLLLVNGAAERYIYRRLRASGHPEVVAMLRLGRRFADVIAIAAGVLAMLHYLGVDPTAALAGLGIGGIAVALAAQKTLENVIGGLSIIFDQAVRVGDFLKLGDTLGTVHYIGLRSTRIRTLDRTVLSVPNGQLANASIETLSARDKFWFHHFVGLRYETTFGQMRTVVDGIHAYLGAHPTIDRGEPIRVRFFRFGPSSLDIELFAYVAGHDWEVFLETQQELLLEVMGIVERAGTAIALPAQTLHLLDKRATVPNARSIGVTRRTRRELRHQTGGA